MSAAYLNPRVEPGPRPSDEPRRASVNELQQGPAKARVEFEIRNDSGETWRAAEGFAVGYHLFDSETGTLIVDGPRLPPPRDISPGESAQFDFTVDWPPEDGSYRVIVSPMREGVAWYYERGWPFLLIEATVHSGAATLEPARVSDAAALRRLRAFRALGRAFTYPVRTIWRNRGLIRVMARRDILGRYRGSFGGSLWTVINPLLLMVTYFFVFGVVLQTRFGNDPSRTHFALYFLAGQLPWLAFLEAAGRAPSIMLEYRSFVKKLVFAVETLPVTLVLSGLVSELFGVALFLIFVLSIRGGLTASILWLPLLLIPQMLFTAGLSWFLAALGVFVRDLGQIMGYVLTVWFFITPICYPEEFLKARAPFLSANPLYILVRGYRAVFLENQAPAFGPLWKFWLFAAAVFVVGHAWFYKLRKSFPDII